MTRGKIDVLRAAVLLHHARARAALRQRGNNYACRVHEPSFRTGHPGVANNKVGPLWGTRDGWQLPDVPLVPAQKRLTMSRQRYAAHNYPEIS